MDQIVIDVTGEPVAWSRSRAARTNVGIRFFQSKKQEAWQDDARSVARRVMGQRPPLDGPLTIVVEAVFPMPSSWPIWLRDRVKGGEFVAHTGTPDLDNLAKNIGDALNKVVWLDDRQITEATLTKRYGERPALRITVRAREGLHAKSKRTRGERA